MICSRCQKEYAVKNEYGFCDDCLKSFIPISYLVATIKSWNISNYNKVRNKSDSIKWHLITNKDDLKYDKIKVINPKYLFFPHWSWKISKEIYENFECIAFHITDLPFGRGGSPLQNLIVGGYKKTKITAFRVTDELDAGHIYLKKDLALDGSAQEIFKRASEIIFYKMIPHIIKESPNPFPQKGKPVAFSRRTPKDSDISNIDDLNKVFDYIRMLDAEGYPKAFIEKDDLKIEFTRVSLKDGYVLADAKITSKKDKKQE